MFGHGWLLDAWKTIMEDKVDGYIMDMSLMPLARTPMDKKGAKALERYAKSLRRNFIRMTPWRQRKATSALRERLKKHLKSGEIAVMVGQGETADNPLFEGMRVIKDG